MVRFTVICPAVASVLMLRSIILLLLSMTVYKKITPITTVDVRGLKTHRHVTGVVVGEALIEAGVISKAATKTANVMLASNLADRLQENRS
ncbi:uncharacterized protein Pyn_21437 [Prunus yedoensis var. nudiflora]|uniref:Uncharacterized protein n=1 Tax=Prunus yedoensis var. nudiflora TaxID=2094558 RepID=A0A314YLI6_PRUYE|nr:uncharacterized protein Pyn_21437 [Prunus yedoensis var. nudiflora]